jgi:hypothetical protein
MTPQEAGAWLAERGLCVSWRFMYRTDATRGGYSETWCTPPPGRIIAVSTGEDGNLIVMVSPDDDVIRPERAQPPLGWGC